MFSLLFFCRNCVFQRRWVRFDGESLAYYNNEKVTPPLSPNSVCSSLFLLLVLTVISTASWQEKAGWRWGDGQGHCIMVSGSTLPTYIKVHWCWQQARARGKRNRGKMSRRKGSPLNAFVSTSPSPHLRSVLPSVTVQFESWLSSCCVIMRGGDQWVGLVWELYQRMMQTQMQARWWSLTHTHFDL